MALSAEKELLFYQLATYIHKHGFDCYISDGELYMEREVTLPSGAKVMDTVRVTSFDQINKLMLY